MVISGITSTIFFTYEHFNLMELVYGTLGKYLSGRGNYIKGGMPPQLSGFVCTYHPATLDLSRRNTIYAFYNL